MRTRLTNVGRTATEGTKPDRCGSNSRLLVTIAGHLLSAYSELYALSHLMLNNFV